MMNKILILFLILVVAGVLVLVMNGRGGDAGKDQVDDQNPPNSAENAPPGSIHNLPLPTAVAAAKLRAAKDFGVEEKEVLILTAYEREWSDGCLGLGGPAELCTDAITPGYEVTVQVKGAEQKYRTNADGLSIRRDL